MSEQRRRRIDRVMQNRIGQVTIVLERLYDPHNGAAVMRTAEALGLTHVHVVEGDEPYFCSRKVSKAAHKWLNIYVHRTIEECATFLRQAGFTLWAALPPPLDTQTTNEHFLLDVQKPLALVFGNEHHGLTKAAIQLCDKRFSIPLPGFTESLNLSVSVALALHHTVEQRLRLRGRRGDLPPAIFEQLRAAYYVASVKHSAELVQRHLQSPPV